MTPRQREIDALCRKHGVSDAVRERIVRLNPQTPEGAILRGYYPSQARMPSFHLDMVGRGDFIEANGRAAWDAIPNGLKHRSGRREYVARTMMEDSIWMIWADLIPPPPYIQWYPTKKYANDPGLTVEIISADEFLARRQPA